MLIREVKFLIYNPPANFCNKFQGYEIAEFTGARTVLGHLVQEAFKSPLSVDSHIQLHFMMPLCLIFGSVSSSCIGEYNIFWSIQT